MENVEVETNIVSQIESEGIAQVESSKNAESETEGSLESLSRFKNSADLIKAYTCLEKEFTKRSQKLKALERELQASKSQEQPPQYTQKDWQSKVDLFLKDNPQAIPFKKQISKTILDLKLSDRPDCLELALAKVLINNYRAPASLTDDGDFLDKHIYSNDKIKNKIIKDYLCAVKEVRSPKTISGGGQPALTPAKKPKSFGEAGKMAFEQSVGDK